MTLLRVVSLALAFTLAPLSHASEHIRSTTFRHRRQSVPTNLPGNWTSKGCYTDNVGARTLSAASFVSSDNMTAAACINFCDSKNYIYAGTEFSQECYCDNFLNNGATTAPATDCNTPCTGNTLESCGAGGRLNLYWSGQAPPPPPVITPNVGKWLSLGCHSDNVNGVRSLPIGVAAVAPLTIKTCTDACFNAGYPLSGAEFSQECYCGAALASGGTSAPAGDCDMVCAGNSSEFCGGPNRLNVYNYTGTDLPAPQPPQGGGGGAPVFPVTSGLPGNWSYNACYVDNAFGRIIENAIPANTSLTVQSCITTCAAQNHTVAGVEFGQECYCGDRLIAGAVPAVENTCNIGCGGNTTQACGGANRMSVYASVGNLTILPVPTTQKTGLPDKWEYAGCLREPQVGKVLPWHNVWPTNNTALACVSQCAAFGYDAAGMEFGQECWCGDKTDVDANGAGFGDESECSVPCPGDPIHLCGAGNRLSLYEFNGTMNLWHTPDNIGRYEFLVPGVVVPLIATLGINNKVTFLEKGGTGFANSSGAYELDLSLAHNFSAAWREMHVKTDIFCSGSIILPDKAGRQINVGGWSLDSTFGVRLYTPDGVPGINSTNDWEEDFHVLKLQRGRWYPSAAMLANGSILVIGGEIGSNDKPQPNLEVLPKPDGGDTVVELDWLARTDPNNLYPFVMVLPSSRLFVAYYNEARILDPATFDTVQELPNMPAAVDDFLGGRTYPLEGAAMIFPQYAPYTDPLRILVCGGSGLGAGIALDSCLSIEPEAPNPTWTLERMPSKRVMPCMVGLPDGTFMIMNGAHQGVAGFGLANDPNLNAVLYDPTLPIGQRFSILNNTIVARMYHSEATLLPDGSILVSGSDPQTDNPDGTVKYPEEFRIEVYIPPYLNEGFIQPEFNISDTDWAYGGTYTINNVKLHQGKALRISLIAATSSTHGNAMGARTIFPAFSCSGATCTITAPPNSGVSPPGWHQLFILDGPTPSHSKWVRIGGDPSRLGEWPALPGFTPPGM